MGVVAVGTDGLADCAAAGRRAVARWRWRWWGRSRPGDAVLVHAGVAIAHLGRAAA